MLDRLLAPLAPKAKAAYGVGVAMVENGVMMSSVFSSDQTRMAEYQQVWKANRWVRAVERVISQQVGSVPWHLEDENGETVTDDAPPEQQAIRNLLEKPYQPLPTDPINNTPRTRSALWGLTSRHQGVCGSGFWLLDQRDAAMGIPLQILYINPSRMTPNNPAGRLIGWTVDADNRGGGLPLPVDDVLQFTLEEADSGWFPPGLVETAMSSHNITRYADRHSAQVLASGGKMPGVFSPKADAGTLPDPVFAQLEKELRAGMEGNTDGRRSFILKGPIDFTPTAATPEQLDLVAIQAMARDDVLELWGVPLSQLGGSPPTGLNSGGTKGFEEAALWQKAVHPRLERMRETIQFQLLDVIAVRTGLSLQIVFDEPTFDDNMPLYETANKAQYLPLRNWERRALIGLDPLGQPDIDNAIWMPATIVELAAAPEDAAALAAASASIKAAVHLPTRRMVNNLVPKMKRDLQAFLDEQKSAIVAKVRSKSAHLAKNPTDSSVWWDGKEWDKRLEKVLRPYAAVIADMTAESVSQRLTPAKAAEFTDLTGTAVMQRLLKTVGVRITGINETTRDKVVTAIKNGIDAGHGAAELGDDVEAATAFDEYRAELIARTESNQVLNASQIESYREYDVSQVQAIDGDGDEECAARDGQVFDLDDALAIEDHPNGTLDWEPVIGKAAPIMEAPMPERPRPDITFAMPSITIPMTVNTPDINLTVPPQPAPTFYVPSPTINVEAAKAPDVTVNVPETVVNVPAPIVNIEQPEGKADTVQDVRVVEMPPRVSQSHKTIKRTAGLITEVFDETVET